MTFRKTRIREVKARALTDPRPAFVSIVKAGANQAPFRSVKMMDADKEDTMVERIEEMRQRGFEVHRMRFTTGEGTEFENEEAVRAWLVDGGYPVQTLKEVDGGFEIVNADDDFDDETVVQIDTPVGGVTVWVGRVEGDEHDGTSTSRGIVRDVELSAKKKDDANESGHERRTSADGEAVEDDEGHRDVEDSEKLPGRKPKRREDILQDARSTVLDAPMEMSVDPEVGDPDPEPESEPAEAAPEGAEKDDDEVEAAKEPDAEVAEKDDDEGAAKEAEAAKELDAVEGGPEVDEEIVRIVKAEIESRKRYATEQLAQRFDDFFAHFSEAMTMGGVLDDANDGIPVGFGEAVLAMVVAMRNNISAGNVDAVRSVAAEFGNMVAALAEVSMGDEGVERATKMIDTFAQFLNGGEEEAEGGTEDSAVLKAIALLAEKIDANQAKVDAVIVEVEQKVKEVHERADASEAGLTERVGKLESRRQTRKSVDVDGDEGNSAKSVSDQEYDELAMRNSLGIAGTGIAKAW